MAGGERVRHVDRDTAIAKLNVVHLGARLLRKVAVVHGVHAGQRQAVFGKRARLVKAHDLDFSRDLVWLE